MENETIKDETLEVEEEVKSEEVKQDEVVITQETKKEKCKRFVRVNKKFFIIGAIVIAVLVIAYFCKSFFVVATVDGSPISRISIISKLEKTSGKALLDSVVTEKLIQNEIKARKIVVSDEEISAEIKKVEDQIKSQGGTIDEALKMQSMTIDDLKKQILLQKEVEKMFADKIGVTDQEVSQYIQENKITIPKGQEVVINGQVKSELVNQKLQQEAQALITELKAKADIKYFVDYK